jgi:hypothetical protein
VSESVEPLQPGEHLTPARTCLLLREAALKLVVDESAWAGGFARPVARWLESVATEVDNTQAGTAVSDRQLAALVLANAYLRDRMPRL